MLIMVRPSRSSPRKRATSPKRDFAELLVDDMFTTTICCAAASNIACRFNYLLQYIQPNANTTRSGEGNGIVLKKII